MGRPDPRVAAAAVAVALAVLLLFAASVAASIAGRVVEDRMIDSAFATGELSFERLFWMRLLFNLAALLLAAVLAGYLVARWLLRAGEEPGRRLYLLAAAPPLTLALLATTLRALGGSSAVTLTVAFGLEAAGAAPALLGCFWACWRQANGGSRWDL